MPLKSEVRNNNMRNFFIITILLLAPSLLSAATDEYKEDVNYTRVSPEQPGGEGNRIQVQEFFMYSCGHCNALEPFLEEWLKNKPEDVDFVRVPAMFDQPVVILQAKVHYALQLIGADEAIHKKIFHAIHVEKKGLRTESEIDAFLQANGVDMPKFHDAMKSFAILTSVRKAAVLAEDFGIRGVPALAVDGKYLISGQKGEVMVGALEQLIAEVRKTKSLPSDQSDSKKK
jgi:protein dithiol oxidoreductase (disulfide-forming)